MGLAPTEQPQDLEQIRVTIEEAINESSDDELAEIAISLFGQLGAARAEISRLRASLQSSLRALSAGPR